MLLPLLLTLTLAAADAPAFSTPTDEPGYLYKVTLVRAAPGKLLDLIALQKDYLARYEARGDTSPFWMRHSQGDQWDLLLLFPMESYAAYYHSDRLAHRQALADDEETFRAAWRSLVAWQEDLFAYGPALEEMQQAFAGASFYHVEMFQALPGMHEKLYEQREMENAYYDVLGRPGNLIFARDQGAAWDVITIGFYRDLKHFAESADIPLEDEERAAKAAGFESVYAISPYLRSLILQHHDTLAVAVR